MIAIKDKKRQVIEKVASIANDHLLDSINQLIDNFPAEDADLDQLVKPMRDTLDIDQLKVEQNYQGFNRAKTEQLIKEIDLQEPLEELLKSI